ncbi:MAG: hypothetical protein D6699_05785 [Aquificota bacterium]|nr:MAG: hypothetical protein D6699_05785 [Aquificota bacterium]
MLVCFPAGENRVRFYFDSKADRDMFIKGLEKLSGVVKVEGKENTRSLLVVYQKGSFAEQIINSLMGRKEVKGIGKEDLHFYLSPFIKHPAVKLLFSMAMLGGVVGLITFGVCSLFLVPYLKTKL